MTDSTNNSFEEQWQHAFDDAELTPPESVWEKIELGLPDNTLPSKPKFGNKPYYFLGGIIVGLLGAFLWFTNTEKEIQIAEKEKITVQKLVVKTEPINLNNEVEVITKKTNQRANSKAKFVEVVDGDINHGAENHGEKVVEVVGGDTNHGAEEIPIRTLTDSVEMIEPLASKSIHSEMENPTINLPTDQTPYYVKPTPKSKKKSILKNVKISMGAGVYQ